MEDNKPLVIVLSHICSTGLSMARSLGAAGYTVDMVACVRREGMSRIAASSKYLRKSTEVVARKIRKGKSAAAAMLVDELLKYANQSNPKPILLPTDDVSVSVIDQYMDVLNPHFQMPHIVGGTTGSLTSCMNKALQAQLAKEVGLQIPKQWSISLKEKIRIPADMVYPCFCKPIESTPPSKNEMAVCDCEESLQIHLEEVKERHADSSVLVQEFLNIDSEISLSGVCNDQQVILPAAIQASYIAQQDKGVPVSGAVMSLDMLADAKEKIFALMKQLHYVGMFEVELFRVGDALYFNEINLRSSTTSYAYFKCGVNLPDLAVRQLLGQAHTAEEAQLTQCNKTFVCEKAAWADCLHGYLPKKALDEMVHQADIPFIACENDPVPQKLFAKKMQSAYRVRRAKNFILEKILPVVQKVLPPIIGIPQTKKKNRREYSTKPRVLICGRNYSSNLCLARAFGQGGYDVEVLRVFQVRPKFANYIKVMMIPDAFSKYIKAFHICITHRKSRNLVERLIQLADLDRKMLLIPADDLAASITDNNLELLSQYYTIPNIANRQGAINNLMSKQNQTDAALAAKLPVVNSTLIASQNGEFTIPDSVCYPCFIKPNVSKNGSKTKMCKCDSREELHAKLTEYSATADIEMLVEDFINIKREYALLGVSTKNGVFMPGFFGTNEGGNGGRRGIAMTGETAPHTGYEELFDSIRRFVGSLDFEGLFDVDLIETVEGKMYFVELNLRFGGSGYSITASGVNLPGMFADYMLLHKPLNMDARVTTGRTFVNEKVMFEEFMEGFLTRKDMRRIMKEADIHFIYQPDDRKAYSLFRFLSWICGPLRFRLKRKRAKLAEKSN